MLEQLLAKKKRAILEKWFHRIVETYPPDTSQFLKREKDPFANPVGSTILQGIDAVYEELLHGGSPEKFSSFLDRMIRIRAVQDFLPSTAIGFVFFLKRVIQEELGREVREKGLGEELLDFERQIDDLALLAFDVYMQCREKIFEVRIREVKAEKEAAFKLLEITDQAQRRRLEEMDSRSGKP
jgi:hypothetical protein